jgi:sulfite exporter TauE/SafE
MEFIPIAFSIGFVGSLHCVGMCGPIALALPVHGKGMFARLTGSFSYNTGRIITYSLLGIMFGLLGKGFVIAGYQQWLSLGVGIAILIAYLVPVVVKEKIGMTRIMLPVVMKVKSLLGSFLQQRTPGSFLITGILNGLLPCGLVYLAVAGAIATGNVAKSSLFMALFGLGTIPAMLGVAIAKNRITQSMRRHINKAVPVFAVLMACLLVLRGLNLNIPYLSPELSKTDCTKQSCCAKK